MGYPPLPAVGMHIHLTNHARDSLKVRWGCAPEKYLKIAQKAWKSEDRVLPGDICHRREYEVEIYPHKTHTYRKFMNKIFIFDLQPEGAVLVTVHPPASDIRKKQLTRS